MSHGSFEQDRLYRDAELAQFYDAENAWDADLEFCLGLAEDAQSVLDLGCGTGQLAAKLAAGKTVFGVDPAEAMLAVGRARPGGETVTWVHADARDIRLGRRFDLVLLTGHAFQVFLTDADQAAILARIAEHLEPTGRFVFDTRNPARQAWRSWTRSESLRRFEHPRLGEIEGWNSADIDPKTMIVTYETHYRVLASGQSFSASSQIYFNSREGLAALIETAGLKVERWMGDWHGGPCLPDAKEIIPLGRLA